MWCLPCLKPPKTQDIYEDEVARYRILEDELFAKGIQESLNQQDSSHPPRGGRQEKEEAKRGTTIELESPLGYNEDAQFAEAVKKSLKDEEERKQEQFKNDEKIAKDLQNMVASPPRVEILRSIPRRGSLDVVDEQLDKAIKESLKEEIKRKQLEEQANKKHDNNSVLDDEDELLAMTIEKSLEEKGKGKIFEDVQIAQGLENILSKMKNEERTRRNGEFVLEEEDKQLAEAIEKSLMEKGKGKQIKDEVEEDEKLSEMTPHSVCAGCNSEIDHTKSVDISGVLWHPDCLTCDACQEQISIHKVEDHVSNSRGKFHKSCYERFCYICKKKKMRKFYQHHFWKERYCRSHESDGTPKCCSCERLEPWGTIYVILDDGRRLCLECMESAIMDSHECQHLHFEIREYFEGLQMKIEKEFPFLLVEKQALNKAEKEEKIENQHQVVTRGICLSEAQTVMSVSKATRTGPNIDTDKEPQRVVRDCEVTAILILYGLPRLLTGYILAHEMMHAYLRLNGHRKLNKVHEEGICQVLGQMWLESQTYATTDATTTEPSSSSSSITPAAAAANASSKKGEWSDFEKKLVEFCKNQIETDESPVYGDGFRKVNKMVMNSNLKDTLKEILRLG